MNDLEDLSIKEQLSKMQNPENLIRSCYVRNKNDKSLRLCHEVEKLSRYINGISICFTIFSQLNGKPNDNYVIYEKVITNSMLVQISLLIPDALKVYSKLIMHDRKEKIYLDNFKGQLFLKVDKNLIITYQKTVVKYLFNPKRNLCFVGQTYDSCVAECRIREFTDKRGKYPDTYLTNQDNSSLKISKFFETSLFVWSESCNQFCSQFTDCYKEYFIVSAKDIEKKGNTFYITFELPSHPTTIYEISLKMCFEEYLCLIASILSLWFGFSVLMFSDFCEEIFKRLYNNRDIKLFMKNPKIYQAHITNILKLTNKSSQ